MNPTPESLAALRESADMLAAVCDRAAKCDHLEARNKALQESNDGIAARHGVLQAVIRKAREGLGNVIPECRHMSLPELVTEAAGRIQNLREAADSFSASAPKVEMDALVRENRRLTFERDAARGATFPVGDPAFAMAEQAISAARAERDEWQHRHSLLESVISKARMDLGRAVPLATGKPLQEAVAEVVAHVEQAPAVREIVRRLNAKGMTAGEAERTINETFDELAEARAENGRQAATIAELLYAEVKPQPVVIYRGESFPLHPGETMMQAVERVTTIDPASPHP